MKKRILTSILLAATFATGLVGCGQQKPTASATPAPVASSGTTASAAATIAPSATTAAAKKDTFILAIDADAGSNINVITTGDRYGLMAVNAIFSPLFVYKSPTDIDYALATSVDVSKDGLTYTAHLRSGVKWHDGQAFTADDVVFTFNEMITNKSSNSYDMLQFGGTPVVVTAVDPLTVQFKLASPKPNAMESFGSVYIMPKHIYKDVKDYDNCSNKTIKPIGTGPYKYGEYKEGQSLSFVKNDDYFLGAPKIANVVFKVIADPNTAQLAIQNGEVQAITVLPGDIAKLDSKSIDIYPYSEGRIGYLSFAFKTKTGNDITNQDFRKAIFYAINKPDMIKAAYVSDQYSANPSSFLPSTATYTSNDEENYAFNVDKAKALLKSSGVKTTKLILAYRSGDVVQETQAALIQDNLKQIGITVELQGTDGQALSQALLKHTAKFDMFLGGYIMGIDPDSFATLFLSDAAYNYSQFSDKKLDDLFKKGIGETDPAKRAAIYLALQKQFADDAFFLPLSENKRILAVSNTVGGVTDAKLAPVYAFQDMSKLFFK